MVDGVYTEEKGVLHFVPAPAPTREELAGMLVRIHSRVVKWLERKGCDADESNAPPELSPIEALASAGTHNLHASVTLAAEDDLGRETLCRSCGAPTPTLRAKAPSDSDSESESESDSVYRARSGLGRIAIRSASTTIPRCATNSAYCSAM